ncbi:glycosyltransferase family 39 protein [Geobacillus zalihae]|uniref:ArnT family glycosyltransferase n=1 Tax=Geobacillus TaxID=129337 RepID=UPI00078CBACC|nr:MULTISPECIES: glycosyltransferase family 39 protein [Geobacillus]AMQ20714.1 glycosyltransferase [Geobacillus sp. JS12]WKA46008.1 glycosyltransferase family 39 protein [Geobacillus zalihae]
MRNPSVRNISFYLAAALIFSMMVYNVFYHLGTFPISSWDEARHGVNAYEMLRHGNLIVNTYLGHPDYWNLKPPVSYWAIMIGYKLVGMNALGLRLMSGICATLTAVAIALFVKKRFGSMAAIVSLLALSTSTQYLLNHCARTGDADSLFVFFFTLSILSLLAARRQTRWLYAAGLACSLAFLTKSWHAGNILLIMVLYFLITRQWESGRWRAWWRAALTFVVPVLAWAFARYHYDGFSFFKQMIGYDLLLRSTRPIEGHIGDETYYGIILVHFFFWWLALLVGIMVISYMQGVRLLAFEGTDHRLKEDVIGILLWICVPLLMFTIAKTKIRWYILPVYPPLCMLIGICASQLWRKGTWGARGVLLTGLLFVTSFYETNIQHYIHHPKPNFELALLQQTAQMPVHGYELFMYHPLHEKGRWPQNAVLTAELANDLKPRHGGLKTFLHTSRSLLLVKKAWFSKQLEHKYHLSVLASNRWGYILEKHA